MLLVDDLAAGGTKNLRHTPRGLVTLLISEVNTVVLLVVSLSLMSSTTILQILNEETDINHCYMSPVSSSLI